MRNPIVAGLVALSVLAAPRPAAAWGFEGHKYILDRAIALLPPEIRPFFEKNRVTIVEHAIDPDLWRNVGFDAQEGPRHFVDMDAYGPPPFTALPRDYDEAVKKYGLEFVTKNGLLPWRAQEMHVKLVEAFTQKATYSRDNIKYFAAFLAHYLSDAQVPFHAALNHDGQLTGQWGIHSRFETETFERFRDSLDVKPGPVVAVPNTRDYAFDSLTSSFSYVQAILDADKAAVAGRDVYDDAYFAAFYAKVKPILEQRLADSITAVASVITSRVGAGGEAGGCARCAEGSAQGQASVAFLSFVTGVPGWRRWSMYFSIGCRTSSTSSVMAVMMTARWNSPPPAATPIAALTQIVAAVVKPWIPSSRRMIAPAPRKPMPVTI